MEGTDFLGYFAVPQTARAIYNQVLTIGYMAGSPLTLCSKDGNLTEVLFNASVSKDEPGNVLGALIVARNVTEENWATELRNANKELAFLSKN